MISSAYVGIIEMLPAVIGISEGAPRPDATATINEGREAKGDRRQLEGVPSHLSD